MLCGRWGQNTQALFFLEVERTHTNAPTSEVELTFTHTHNVDPYVTLTLIMAPDHDP